MGDIRRLACKRQLVSIKILEENVIEFVGPSNINKTSAPCKTVGLSKSQNLDYNDKENHSKEENISPYTIFSCHGWQKISRHH